MKLLVTLLVMGCLVVTGAFFGTYLFWHRQEIKQGIPAEYHTLYSDHPTGFETEFLESESKAKLAWARERMGGKLEGIEATKDKIAALVGALLTEVQPFMGIPNEETKNQTGLELYEAVLQGESSVWGDHLNRIYVAVASAMGIPTRLVEVSGTRGGPHRFAESYISEEGHWAFVDVSSRKAYVIDEQGHLLNAVELFEAIQNHQEETLSVALYQGGRIVEVDYTQHALPEHYYFQEGHKLSFPRAPHLYGSSVRRLGYQLLSPRRTLVLENHGEVVLQGFEMGTDLAVE